MYRILALLTALTVGIVFANQALAGEGGEGDNTTCSGVGNVNSYCDGSEIIDNPPTPVDECNPEVLPTPPVVGEGVCNRPLDAASAFLATPFEFAPTSNECPKQCRAVTNTCKAVVEGNSKCFDGLIKGIRKFTLANCENAADPKVCNSDIRAISKANTLELRRHTTQATAICLAAYDTCVVECSSGE